MTTMKVFNKIHECKKKGWSYRKISRELDIHRKTVSKFLRMTQLEYLTYVADTANRAKYFDKFKDKILSIYEANAEHQSKIKISSIYDCLIEEYGTLGASERSLRNYIKSLKKSGILTISPKYRPYKPVPELPYGKQMQLDFGMVTLGKDIKAYIFAALLSRSRYKFVSVQDRPFTTVDVIQHLLDCFDYFEGVPDEIAIDQDRTMVVSENKGDIIFTNQFQYFKEEIGFKMFVCRAADPESKGKVENLVKFVKGNFFSARTFETVEEIRESISKWLERKANGSISQATLEIPAIAFEREKSFLKPIRNSIFKRMPVTHFEQRKVDKLSLISFLSNKYSVPIKYRGSEVLIQVKGKELFIYDPNDNKEITKHELSLLSGQKITKTDHYRIKSGKIKVKKANLMLRYDIPEWRIFVKKNYDDYKRYYRDQLKQAENFLTIFTDTTYLTKALQLCLSNGQCSFRDLSDSYKYYQIQNEQKLPDLLENLKPIFKNISVAKKIKPVGKRNIAYYSAMLKIINTTIGVIII